MKAEQLATRPGIQADMKQQPKSDNAGQLGTGKLAGKVALLTGGDSGIGRAVAIAFAKEGAKIAVTYLNEHEDAEATKQLVGQNGGECLLLAGDIGDSSFCNSLIQQVADTYGRLDIIVNLAGEQHPQKSIADITDDQLERTFRTNIFGMFYVVRAALPHLPEGGAIINTTSVVAYEGNANLLDYCATKGAIVSFTRGLAQQLAPKKIRVNGVAPGPVWTPLIPSTFPPDKVKEFGKDTPMGRPGQPDELAPCYVFLASDDSSYMTGQTLHLNGGRFMTT